MRLVLTGGGSGGHLFPLVAVIREIRRLKPDAEIYFMGPGLASEEVFAQEGVTVRKIISGKVPRYFTLRLFIEILKLPVGFLQALWRLYWFMPDVIFGKGGYGMVPVVLAAWLYRIPVIIHESDSVAGLATKFASRFSKIILVSFEFSRGVDLKKVKVVGNPVRTSVAAGDRASAQKRFSLSLKPVVLVLGGSQGADAVNRLILDILPDLLRQAEVIHQVGPKNFDAFQKESRALLSAYPGAERFYHAVSFLSEQELADAYAASMLAVSRSGAGAIFELALVALPAILLPLEGSAAGHQRLNAEILERAQAAVVLSGDNFKPHILLSEIQALIGDEAKRSALSQNIKMFARPDAAINIASIILSYAS